MNRLKTDVAIIGSGFAGATAAAMLGRSGVNAVIVDPNAEKRPDFRCEKLSASQLPLLEKTGLADDLLPHTCLNSEIWIVRYGRLIDRRPTTAAGFVYNDFVNAINRAVPKTVPRFEAKGTKIAQENGSPVVALSTGEEIAAKLVILSTGLNPGLRGSLGIDQELLSRCHSISIGFDIRPVGRQSFDFPALTYFPDRPDQRFAYLSLFPVPGAMRANLFVYWSPDDPRLHRFRHNCESALLELLPRLTRFTGQFSVEGTVSIRPVDLVRSTNVKIPGVVLVGDAYSTSCPAAGTGSNKVLTDVERLCSGYIRSWLRKSSIGADDIAAFYADPAKVQCESASYNSAIDLRLLSTKTSLNFGWRRGSRFVAQAVIGGSRSWLPATLPSIGGPSGLLSRR